MKYTHKVTLLAKDMKGVTFLCCINNGIVTTSDLVRDGGIVCGEGSTYDSCGGEDLTPEEWFNDSARWKVEKLNKFKGNK